MARIDYMFDENYDKLIVNGDWAVGDSDEDNVDLILTLAQGHIRHSPTVGVNTTTFLNGTFDYIYKQKVINQLTQDNYIVNLIYQDSDGKIQLDFS